jgi:hypothetical protein
MVLAGPSGRRGRDCRHRSSVWRLGALKKMMRQYASLPVRFRRGAGHGGGGGAGRPARHLLFHDSRRGADRRPKRRRLGLDGHGASGRGGAGAVWGHALRTAGIRDNAAGAEYSGVAGLAAGSAPGNPAEPAAPGMASPPAMPSLFLFKATGAGRAARPCRGCG